MPNQLDPEPFELRFIDFEYRSTDKKWAVFINDSLRLIEGSGESNQKIWATTIDVTDRSLSLHHESRTKLKIADRALVISILINRFTGDYSFWSYEDRSSWTAPKRNSGKGSCAQAKKKF